MSLEDSDSDDDLLLNQSTFRTNRRANAEKKQADQMLKDALKSTKRSLQDSLAVQEMKKENTIDHKELLERADKVQEANRANKQAKVKLEDIDNDEAVYNADGALDKKAMQFLSSVRDTQLTSGLGMKVVLFQDENDSSEESSSNRKNSTLPCTVDEAMTKLHAILSDSSSSGMIPEQLWKDFEIAKHNEALEELLLRLRSIYERHELSIMSMPLQRWLFAVGSASLSSFSEGAFQALMDCWKNPDAPIRPGEAGILWKLQDFSNHVSLLFGFREKRPATKANEDNDNDDDHHHHSLNSRKGNSSGFMRFLQLYNRGLQLGFIISEDMSHLESAICTLLLSSVDPIFQLSEADGNLLYVQSLFSTLLDLAIDSLDNDPIKIQQWTDQVVQTLCSKIMTQLGPGGALADDADDQKAWLSQTAILGTVLSVKDTNSPASNKKGVLEFVGRFVRRVFMNVFDAEEDWDKQVKTILSRHELDEQLQSTSRWTIFGGGYLAIEKLATGLEEGNLDMNGCQVLAIVLAFLSCLDAMLGLQAFEYFFKPHDEDQEADEDEEEQNETEDKTQERQVMSKVYAGLGEKLESIKSSTRREAIGSGTLRRVNQISNILRIYFVDEKRDLKNAANKRKSLSDTLDSWVKKKKPNENSPGNVDADA